MSPAELAVLGTLGGTLAGGLFSMIVAIVSKRSEERRQFRELVVKAAIENWKTLYEGAKSGGVSPMTDFIVHASKVCDLALTRNLTAENARGELKKINALMTILHENAVAVSKGEYKRPA
jgi:hypothetical protein